MRVTAVIRICLDHHPRTNNSPCPFGEWVLPVASPLRASPMHKCRNLLPARHRLRPLTIRGLGLGSDSPWDVCRCPGTLRLPVWRVLLTAIHATHSGILTCGRSIRPLRSAFTAAHNAPLPCICRKTDTSAASGGCLSPVTFSAQGHSTSELLRTLSRMAASKPTSWLSAHPHHLYHSAAL
jgi:hypothetical protein